MRRIAAARSCCGKAAQAGNALCAASIALRASAAVPDGKRPMTCFGSQGLTDSKVADADSFFPPIRIFPMIGRRFSTAVRASRKALRLASIEKSVRGSF